MPPQLAGIAEIIRRHPGYVPGGFVPVQVEQVRTGPDLGAVGGQVNGQVADDSDTLPVAVGFQAVPLPEKQKLLNFIFLKMEKPKLHYWKNINSQHLILIHLRLQFSLKIWNQLFAF